MTTLTKILSVLNEKAFPLGAVQYTPENLIILVNSKKFWQYMEIINQYPFRFQFLEQRTFNSIDIHLKIMLDQTWIFLTFRIIDLSNEFYNHLKGNFPSSKIYIKEIIKRSQIQV